MDKSSPPPADQTAMAQRLFVQHSTHLRGFLVALSPDLAMAEDAFQETFITITAKANTYDPSRDFLAWACGVARLKLMEVGRRGGRKLRPLSDEVLESLSACEPSPLDEDLRLQLLAECTRKLAPQCRRIVEMCYQESHKPAEIAKRMEWSVGAVYVALSRARAVLRQCVDRKMASQGASA